MTCVIPSQMAYSSIISNASHSMHCSSVEAYLLWKCCFNYCSHILIFVAKRDAQSKAWDILLVLTSVAGNLCNKCPSGYSNKTAVKVILSMRSLVSIKQQSPRRPCDILVANVGLKPMTFMWALWHWSMTLSKNFCTPSYNWRLGCPAFKLYLSSAR